MSECVEKIFPLDFYYTDYITYEYEYLPTVVLSTQKLSVDGEQINCEKYNIDGSNYFKLRDLAYVLNGTGSQFGVGWDASSNSVTITTGEQYVPNGSELKAGKDKSSTAVSSRQSIYIDGVYVDDISVYNIGGNNYFKLRDLGDYIGFDVDYDAATKTALVYSREPMPATGSDSGESDFLGHWYAFAYAEQDQIYEMEEDEYWFDLHVDGTYLMCLDGSYTSGTWEDYGDGFALFDSVNGVADYLYDYGDGIFALSDGDFECYFIKE